MALYGNELGPDITPFDAGLDRLVRLDKPGDFVGREALAARAGGRARSGAWSGWPAQTRRVPRHGYAVLWDGAPAGTVTSGAPSPTLGMPIAMAYISPAVADEAGRRRARTAGPDGWRWTSEAAPSLPDWCRCRSTGARPRPRDTIAHRASQPPPSRSFRQMSR